MSQKSFEKITSWGWRELPIEAGKVCQSRLEKVTSEASQRLPTEAGENGQWRLETFVNQSWRRLPSKVLNRRKSRVEEVVMHPMPEKVTKWCGKECPLVMKKVTNLSLKRSSTKAEKCQQLSLERALKSQGQKKSKSSLKKDSCGIISSLLHQPWKPGLKILSRPKSLDPVRSSSADSLLVRIKFYIVLISRY